MAGSLDDFKFLDAPRGHFFADPFIAEDAERVFLFFEDYNYLTRSANLCCAELDRSGEVLEMRTVVQQPYHMSFPHVFDFEGTFYMIPETARANRVELYRAVKFPWEWEFVRVLLSAAALYDPICLRFEGKYWILAGGSSSPSSGRYDQLHIFYAPTIFDRFKPHAANPVKTDVCSARPAGAVIKERNRMIRPAQNCSRWYGDDLTFMQIDVLSESSYSETPFGKLPSSWRPGGDLGIHTYNATEHFEAIDMCSYGVELAATVGRAKSLTKTTGSRRRVLLPDATTATEHE